MRRIILKSETARKQKIGQIILGLLLIALMAAGTLGYAFFSGSASVISENQKVEYKNYIFQLNENRKWQTEIEGYTFSTTYNPLDTENISLDFDLTINEFYHKPLYFVDAESHGEIIENIGQFIERYQDVCLEERNCKGNLVIKNCSSNVFVFENSENLSISRKENCIFITAPREDWLKISNRIIFKVLGIQ